MKELEKNLLDLRHSLYQSKAVLFFAVGLGSEISIFFGSLQLEIDAITSSILALMFTILFLNQSFKNFNECYKIQEKIENHVKDK